MELLFGHVHEKAEIIFRHHPSSDPIHRNSSVSNPLLNSSLQKSISNSCLFLVFDVRLDVIYCLLNIQSSLICRQTCPCPFLLRYWPSLWPVLSKRSWNEVTNELFHEFSRYSSELDSTRKRSQISKGVGWYIKTESLKPAIISLNQGCSEWKTVNGRILNRYEKVYITDDKVMISDGVYFCSTTHVVQLDLYAESHSSKTN